MGKRGTRRRLIFQALVFCAALPVGAHATCRDDAVQIKGAWGEAQFSVDVADDNEERAQGLMFVESMAQSAGMLFIYERKPHASG